MILLSGTEMSIRFDIEKLATNLDEGIDYKILVFKIDMPKKFNLDNCRNYWIFMKALADGGVLKIIIDMQELEYIDSAGIGVFINTTKLLRKSRGDLVFINVSPDIKSIFRVVNLQNFIKMFNLEGEALNYFRYDSSDHN